MDQDRAEPANAAEHQVPGPGEIGDCALLRRIGERSVDLQIGDRQGKPGRVDEVEALLELRKQLLRDRPARAVGAEIAGGLEVGDGERVLAVFDREHAVVDVLLDLRRVPCLGAASR